MFSFVRCFGDFTVGTSINRCFGVCGLRSADALVLFDNSIASMLWVLRCVDVLRAGLGGTSERARVSCFVLLLPSNQPTNPPITDDDDDG